MVDTTYSEFLGDGRPDGTVIGRTTSELIGFHGKLPTAQQSGITTVTTAAATTITLAAGYATTNQADAIVTQLNLVINALINKGLCASS